MKFNLTPEQREKVKKTHPYICLKCNLQSCVATDITNGYCIVCANTMNITLTTKEANRIIGALKTLCLYDDIASNCTCCNENDAAFLIQELTEKINKAID